MRVLMVTDFFWPMLGGVEQHVRLLAQSLAERGHDVVVGTLRVDGAASRESDGPVDVRRIVSGTQRLRFLFDQTRPWAPPVSDPFAARAIGELIDDVRPDVIHGHDWLARSAQRAAERRGIPFVNSLHYYTLTCAKKDLVRSGLPCDGPAPIKCANCAGRHYGWVKGPLIAAATAVGRHRELSRSNELISVSRSTAIGNGLGPDTADCHVIPNFLPDLVPPPSGADLELAATLPAGPFFLFVGDLRAQKGIDVLLDAYASLVDAWPLALIGKTWPGSPHRLPSGATFHGSWPNSAVHEAFRRCAVAIVPSMWTEPFGIVVIEAMNAGATVIGSNIGGIKDIIEHERSGLLVAPGSVGALSEAMVCVMHDQELRQRLGTGARRRASEFRASKVVPLIEAVYRQAVVDADRRRPT